MSSEDQIIESTTTDYVQFPISVKELFDLSTLTWTVSFNPSDTVTQSKTAATIVPGSASQTTTRTGPLSTITVELLVGSGPGGYPLGVGRWHCFAHTTSGARIIDVYCGVLTVNGQAAASPSTSGGYDGGVV